MLQPTSLARLPFDVQEHISCYLDNPDLLALALVSKHLSSLAARALYAIVVLSSSDPLSAAQAVKDDNEEAHDPSDHSLARRQFAFLLAISHHPQYAVFIRHLVFQFLDPLPPSHSHLHHHVAIPHSLIWNAFQKAKGVRSIHLKMPPNASVSALPSGDLFPNLTSATIEGGFPFQALDRILFSSPRLRSLTLLSGTVERTKVPSREAKEAWARKLGHCRSASLASHWGSLDDFISRSITHGAFQQLEALSVVINSCHDTGFQCHHLQAMLSESVTPYLTRLSIGKEEGGSEEEEDDDELDKALGAHKRERLESLSLKGCTVTSNRAELLKQTFPAVDVVEISDPVDRTETWCMLL